MLEIRIQEKRFEEVLFKNIHLSFSDYGMIGITGESGRGKSTLLNMIADLDTDYLGEIMINNQNVHSLSLNHWMSYGFSTNYLLNYMKGKEYLELLEHDHYLIYNDLLDFNLELPISSLSRGQMQRLSLVYVLIQNRPILLLDEIISGQDEEHSRKMLKSIHDYSSNHLVIIVSHDQKLMKEYCDEVIELKNNLEYVQNTDRKYQPTAILKKIDPKQIILKYRKKDYFLVTFSLTVVCMMIVILYLCSSSLSSKLMKAIQDYFPDYAYSFHSASFEYEDFIDYYSDCQVYFCIDDYELTGILNESDRLYLIDDYTNEADDLLQGELPLNEDEIIIGSKISESLDLGVGDRITLVYLHNQNEVTVDYTITGIEEGNEISFLEGGELSYLKRLYGVNSSYVIVSCQNEKTIEKILEKETRDYLKVGKSIVDQVQSITRKVKRMIRLGGIICLWISIYAICTLLNENVSKNKRMIGFFYLNMVGTKEIFVTYFKIYLICLMIAVLFVHGLFQGIVKLVEIIINTDLYLFGVDYYLIYGIIAALWSILLTIKYVSVLHDSKINLLKKIK